MYVTLWRNDGYTFITSTTIKSTHVQILLGKFPKNNYKRSVKGLVDGRSTSPELL
jgi:hypothetical protein